MRGVETVFGNPRANPSAAAFSLIFVSIFVSYFLVAVASAQLSITAPSCPGSPPGEPGCYGAVQADTSFTVKFTDPNFASDHATGTGIELWPAYAGIGESGCITPPGSPALPQCSSDSSTYCILGTSASGTVTASMSSAMVGTLEFCGYSATSPSYTLYLPDEGITAVGGGHYGTFNLSATQLLPGASASISYVVYNAISDPTASSSACPYQLCTVIAPPHPAPSIAACPSIISGFGQCDPKNPSLPCFLTPNTVPSCVNNPACGGGSCPAGISPYICNALYFTPNSLPASSYGYDACGYYTSNANGDPSTASYVASEPFNVLPVATSYGLTPFSNPAGFQFGAAVVTGFASGLAYGQQNGYNPSLCFQGNTCYIELASQAVGCVAPYGLPGCGNGAISPSGIPCILNTLPNQGFGNENQGGIDYQQILNTQYFPTANYLLCGYDYMNTYNSVQVNNPPSEPSSPSMPDFGGATTIYPPPVNIVSPFFSVMALTCNSQTCNIAPLLPSTATTIPTSLPPPCTSNCGGFANAGVNLGPLQATACNIYGPINSGLLILALALMILGAAAYAVSSALPGSLQGQIRSYGGGLLLVGVVSATISSVSIGLIAVATSNTIAGVLALC